MKKHLIIPLVAAIMALVWGCSNEQLMGGDLVPPSDKSKVHSIDTVSINAFTEMETDSISTGNYQYLLVGAFSDPLLGKTEASFAAKFSNTSHTKFTADCRCDSIVVTLGLDTTKTRFYGDSLSPVTLNVYLLQDSLSIYRKYYHDFDITPYIGQEPVTSVQFVPAKADSLVSFRLDKEYGDMVIRSVIDTTFDDNCPGFFFTLTSENTMVRFYKTSSFTEYTLYYHNAASPDKSREAYFSIATTDPRVSMFSHDYTGCHIKEQLDDPRAVKDTVLYMQGMVGTAIRIEFPEIKSLLNLNGKYSAITNARLVMPLADSIGSCENICPPIDYFSCKARYSNGLTFYPADFLTNPQTTSANIASYLRDTKNRRYELDVTGQIVKMLNACASGNAIDYALYIFPSDQVSDFKRSVINSPTHPTNPMKLVLEYVEFEK